MFSGFSHEPKNVAAIISCSSKDENQFEMHFQYEGHGSPPSEDEEGHLHVFFPYQALEIILNLLRSNGENILVYNGEDAELLSSP